MGLSGLTVTYKVKLVQTDKLNGRLLETDKFVRVTGTEWKKRKYEGLVRLVRDSEL